VGVSLSVAGGLFLAAQRGSAPAPAARSTPHRRSRPLLHGGVLLLIGLHLGIGVFFDALQVSVTAFVVEHGQPGAAAPIFAVSSGSGLRAGWLYGLRRWRAAPAVHLLIATGVLMPATWLLLTVGSPLHLGCLVVLTGATIPPLVALFSQLTESAVHPCVLTQAFSRLGSAGTAGSASAAALSGWAIDTLGPRGGFTVTATAATAMTHHSLAGLRLFPAPANKPADTNKADTAGPMAVTNTQPGPVTGLHTRPGQDARRLASLKRPRPHRSTAETAPDQPPNPPPQPGEKAQAASGRPACRPAAIPSTSSNGKASSSS